MRITQSIQNRITKAALAAAFAEREAALMADEIQLAEDVWRAEFGEHEKVLDALPQILFNHEICIRVKFGNEFESVRLTKQRQVPYAALRYEREHEFSVRWRNLRDARSALAEQKEEVRAEIKKLVKGASTLRKLEQVWPEGKPFFPEDVKQLPAVVSASRVNTLLGIAA